MDNLVRQDFQRGFWCALPAMVGFIPVGLLLGTQAAAKGLSWLEVPLMTGINFAGGSEFVAIGLWSATPAVLLIATMSFLINTRHFLMSAALVPYWRERPLRQVLPLLFFMCDECWALSLDDARKHSGRLSPAFYLGVTAALYPSWVLFTALGAAWGTQIGDLSQFGFDMAFTAIFLVLLKGMWKGLKSNFPWLVSLVVAALVYQLVDGAWYVAAGALAGLATTATFAKHQA